MRTPTLWRKLWENRRQPASLSSLSWQYRCTSCSLSVSLHSWGRTLQQFSYCNKTKASVLSLWNWGRTSKVDPTGICSLNYRHTYNYFHSYPNNLCIWAYMYMYINIMSAVYDENVMHMWDTKSCYTKIHFLVKSSSHWPMVKEL